MGAVNTSEVDLQSHLAYEPRELKFGTSGRRGEVAHLTQLEVYLNVRGELRYLQTLSPGEGGIAPGDEFYFGYDLRPSSSAFVPEFGGRGEIAQAVERAIADSGMRPINLGCIPTPAVTSYAIERQRGSIMVTGSHIPFDRNGYKTNTSRGELLKSHEAPIGRAVEQVRCALYREPYYHSLFDERGMFKCGPAALLRETKAGRSAYIERYAQFFPGAPLTGARVLVYQHSSVGRDILVEILEGLGAEVIPAGRSERFVPIDTENVDAAMMATVQGLADAAHDPRHPLTAVVSLDGDADRPLILGVDSATGRLTFFGGDLVGMVVAEFLGADAVVVPVSCNDAIDRGPLAAVLEPRTRIGSPYVIAGIDQARARGRRLVCGWEANGGFLLGSDIEREGKRLSALPTRDAVLPIVATLLAARQRGVSLNALFESLPRRFSRAAVLKDFPRPTALRIMEQFGEKVPEGEIVDRVGRFFTPALGFPALSSVDRLDGIRMTFSNGEVAHFRPSGNADEFRIYAVADTQDRANFVAQAAVAEPDGILRKMEKAFGA
jgi:phosphomannomutase